MTNLVRNAKDGILTFQNDPTRIQSAALALVRDSYDGVLEIVDCTNPFVALMETGSVMTSAAMEKMDVVNRKQYPIAAQSIEDLYPHMSDKDYPDRFATPSETTFILLAAMEEIDNLLVEDPTTKSRKLIIPAHTYFTIANTTFSIQYPIVISKLAHGEYQVLYDVTNPSPLQTLATNEVPWEIRADGNGQKFMAIRVEVQQFSIVSEQESVNRSKELQMTTAYVDQFYFARVWHGSADTGWTELSVTHTDQIYDVTKPTAVLKVLDGIVVTRIPQIYINNGKITEKIRVDIYQTKGPLSLSLVDYPIDAAVTTFLTLDKSEDNQYTAPLKELRQFHAFSPFTTRGGTNALPFEKLRERVIQGTMGLQERVITNIELPSVLETKGYEVVANIDNITNRVFVATREMPVPSNPKLITPAAASIETIATSIQKLLQLDGVIDNGKSVTITPKVLYQNVSGVVKPIAKSTIDTILGMSADQRALTVSNSNFMYTPFHYVLDMTTNEFDLRAYHLDAPSIDAKIYVDENDKTLMQVSTASYSIERTESGYRLIVMTKSSDTFKDLPDDEVFVQMAFVPNGEKDRAYINGVLVNKTDDDERVFTFDLSTNFNVDSEGNIMLKKFMMYTTAERLTGAKLTTQFDLIYSVSSYMGPQWVPNGIDRALGRFLLPSQVAGVAHEQLRIVLGLSLKTLWSRARTVVNSGGYQTWDVDVPLVYEQDVLERDANGSAVQIIDGKAVINYLHRKGDPFLDEETGEPILKFKKGDVMLDPSGNPIPASNGGLDRQIDLFLVDGAYWFATDATATAYRTELTNTVVTWLSGDLDSLSKRLLEQTRLYFYPKVNTGYIDAMVADGTVLTMSAAQSFRVDLAVNKTVHQNAALKKRLSDITIQTLSEALGETMVSISAIQKTLSDKYGDDVLDVSVSGLGGKLDHQILSIVDDGNRFSLKKRLVAQTDGTLIVEEDVTVNFILHARKD